jgi:AhpD family alkylhydroperoxidase
MGAMIRHLTPPRRPESGLGAEVWDEMQRELGVAPPLSVHVAEPEILAAAWAVLRETVLAEGLVARGLKEAIATAISETNRCPYCVDVHSMFVHAARRGPQAGAPTRQAALVDWAHACRSPGDPRLLRPPFSREEMPEIVGTAAAFVYINRIVTVLLDESPFPVGVRFLRAPLGRLAGRFLARSVARPLAPGTSLARLPEVAIPEHLSWALGRPTIARAFAGHGAAAARRVVPVLSPAGQAQVAAVLGAWRGEEPPFGRAWLEDAVAGLPAADTPAAHLALLVALAPARVTTEDVAAFAARAPGDAPLIALLSWTAYETARRATTWLRGPY